MGIQKLVSRLQIAFTALAILGLLLAFPASALAANTYGCGEYGRSAYEENCPASSTTATSTPTTTTVEAPAEDNTPVILNVYDGFFAETGITITSLEVGDVIGFCTEAGLGGCDSTREDYHTITIKKIDLSDPNNPIVTLTFASSPFDVDFTKESPKQIDVDKDGNNDVEVTLVDLVGDKAILTIKKLNKKADSTNQTATTPSLDEKKPGSKTWLWAGLVGFAILIVIILISRRATREKNVTF